MSKEDLYLIEGQGIAEELTDYEEVESMLYNDSQLALSGLNNMLERNAELHEDRAAGRIDDEELMDELNRNARYLQRRQDLAETAGISLGAIAHPGSITILPTVAALHEAKIDHSETPSSVRKFVSKFLKSPKDDRDN